MHQQKANELKLANSREWQILLHMNNGRSEIADETFFLSKERTASSELNATVAALLGEQIDDDNSTACRFPARALFLKEKLGLSQLPNSSCRELNAILKRVDPSSVTMVFPSAHVNSPASMFGHTFLRINSSYNSKLLSYAINYAAHADPDKENAVVFAAKGLFGGYYGKYSLLPYYDKLKEYRDSEQRDIWEYDLNLTKEEVHKMTLHMWELKDTLSDYYFFTQNCSYTMLWFLEAARPSLHLREHFGFQVIPLETVHVLKDENLIIRNEYRPSKRALIVRYTEFLNPKEIEMVEKLSSKESDLSLLNKEGDEQKKRYILEASLEFLEFNFSKSRIQKDDYLRVFHSLSSARAKLGLGEKVEVKTPPNPVDGHRAIRAKAGFGNYDGDSAFYLGIRPAYHDLQDSSYGFLRGTQIEFLDFELSRIGEKSNIEKATIISITSLAQRKPLFNDISWRVKLGWDREYLDEKSRFNASVGGGFSAGDSSLYGYALVEPLAYLESGFKVGVGGVAGVVLDKYAGFNTNLELTRRFFEDGAEQSLIKFSQGIRTSQNSQISLVFTKKDEIESYKAYLSYYF